MASSPLAHGAHHHPALAHQFDTMEQQKESSTLGMWLFLVTEIMFFGGLFLTYVVYRIRFHEAFLLASNSLNVVLGGVNTAVLIGSSLTMALAIWAAQVNWRRGIVIFLLATIGLGSTFLVIKGFEYHDKFVEHHVPGPNFHFVEENPSPHIRQIAARDPGLGRHTSIFFSLYFIMTGLHATHMVVGIAILIVMVILSSKGKYDATYYNPLEMTGLYWHFVDIVWIFLFPLLYLLGAHAAR